MSDNDKYTETQRLIFEQVVRQLLAQRKGVSKSGELSGESRHIMDIAWRDTLTHVDAIATVEQFEHADEPAYSQIRNSKKKEGHDV